MAYNDNQNEYPLPTGKNDPRQTSEFLPRYFRTDANKKFLGSTLDQFANSGVVEKLSGFVGRREAKAVSVDDNYVDDINAFRNNYQFEPATVYEDKFGNAKFYKDYKDLIGLVNVYKGTTANHSKLNEQEFYTWNPHIDFDKFSNFREYYWLPNGPQEVPVKGQALGITSTYQIKTVIDDDNTALIFTPDGKTRNPRIKLYRGQTYRFEVNTDGSPISIATSRSVKPDPLSESISLISTLYTEGVTLYPELDPLIEPEYFIEDGYIEKGVIEFTIPENAPDTLYVVSQFDLDTSCAFDVFNIEENSVIDVEAEIIGKKTYTTSDGWSLSNGMKVYFIGNVTPETYATGFYYVEGVGSSISLVPVTDLQVPAVFTQDTVIPFDTNGFDRVPFSDAKSYAGTKDYIVMARTDSSKNAWSRYNRWFHKDVIAKSAEINNQLMDLDQSARAKRPIIEFEPGIRLLNHGTKKKNTVDLIDTYTKDVFSTIEGSIGHYVDGVELVEGMRVLFVADPDSMVNGKIYKVTFIRHLNNYQISLIEDEDALPFEDETVLIRSGNDYAGRMFWYNGTEWVMAQDKTKVNQPIMFDLYDENGISFSDTNYYDATDFKGNKIFSYREGEGVNDVELGFPLVYKNLVNSGDIIFDNNIQTDMYSYKVNQQTYTINSDVGFFKIYNEDGDTFEYANGWTKAHTLSRQFVVQRFTGQERVNNLPIDVYNNSASLTDLIVKVYKNNDTLVEGVDYSLVNVNTTRRVVLTADLESTDIVVIKTYTTADKNDNGYYEIPSNFENNPLNNNLSEFTFGQINEHITSITQDLNNFVGIQPGANNLRDLGNVSSYGTKFVQHSGPINLPLYHLADENADILKSIIFAKDEYSKFKKSLIQIAENIGVDTTSKKMFELVMKEYVKTKAKTMPFYSSDMIGFGGYKELEYTVLDYRNPYFALSTPFNLNSLTNKAVYVYLNGEQLVHGVDYTFTDEGFVLITATLSDDDIVTINEYENTEASYIPQTPSVLGIYPKYVPEKFVDTSYAEPVEVIRGHDGSITIAYGDYRDDLLIELERRIFNNIKVEYNPSIFDIADYVPSLYRNTGITHSQINNILISEFIKWARKAGNLNYTDGSIIQEGETFTYNYSRCVNAQGQQLPGFWREVYKNAFDTDRPHTHPWEMLGFSIMPSWWTDVYGPAPYTKDNLILWKDLEKGVIREPGKAVIRNKKYLRPGLVNNIPVNEYGELISPLDSGYAKEFSFRTQTRSFAFGDGAPVETAWRRSSDYPYSLMMALIVLRPARVFGLTFDRSRIKRNFVGQLVYEDTEKRLRTKDLVFPKTKNNNNVVYTAGLVNWIAEAIYTNVDTTMQSYIEELTNLNQKMAFKLAGFAEKEKLKLILDSRTPLNKGNVFVPSENYKIKLTTSSPVEIVNYSGVVVEKTSKGYKVKGYDIENPVFKYFRAVPTQVDPSSTVGGISESYIEWSEGKTIVAGKVVRYNNQFYRATTTHTTTTSFVNSNFSRLKELPVFGGVTAYFRKTFEEKPTVLQYGTEFNNVQDLIDFLLGYGKYLEYQGFVFDYFNSEYNVIENWKQISKEFLFWTTQNWAAGTIITLSPAANKLVFSRNYYTVYDVHQGKFGYGLLNENGNQITSSFSNINRDNSTQFSVIPVNTEQGIYFAKLLLVQTEHVVLIDNTTVFNDTIYDPNAGYRQERIKVSGYRTDEWNGTLNIPGFILDDVVITDWEPYQDYTIGDLVKYKEFYYSAKNTHTGTEVFEDTNFNRLPEKPESALKPNWDYRVKQFADFYDLDTDNFDSEQQRLAQHLIGYQKREYLGNIITDDISQYKFYQGFIQDKGTNNALTKLFDKLGSADRDSLQFYEEWAFRVGQYGNTDTYKEFELALDESKFRIEPQLLQLVQNVDNTRTDLTYQYPSKDVYIKPENYNNAPLPVKFTPDEVSKTAGYVKLDQIDFIAKTFNDILALDITGVNIGDCVWVPDYKNTWNVYQHVIVPARIIRIDSTDTGFRATFNKNIKFEVDDLVGLRQINSEVDGFRFVTAKGPNYVEFALNTPLTDSSKDLSDSTTGVVTQMLSKRLEKLDDANTLFINKGVTAGDKIWIDNTGDEKFATYENQFAYSQKQELPNGDNDRSFGDAICGNSSNTILAIGKKNSNQVVVYSRSSELGSYVQSQIIDYPNLFSDPDTGFGTSVDITADGQYLFVGAPYASNVLSRYVGEITPGSAYSAGDIVSDRGTLWRALIDLPEDGSTVHLESQDWARVEILEPDVDGTGSGLADQGMIHVYKKALNGQFELVQTIMSSYPSANEKFGLSIKSSINTILTYNLFVRSEKNDGRIYLFDKPYGDDKFGNSVDETYRGDYNASYSYLANEKVYYNGSIYQATVNVAPGGWTGLPAWELVDADIDRLGYLPIVNILDGDVDSTTYNDATNIGKTFDVSKDGEVLIILSKNTVTEENQLNVYRKQENRYKFYETINSVNADEEWGISSSINETGSKIAVGAVSSDTNGLDSGAVYVYTYNTALGEFELSQTLYAPVASLNERFGHVVKFSNNDLVVLSTNGINNDYTIFDNTETYFDSFSTQIVDTERNYNQVYVYNSINDVLVYGETLEYNSYYIDGGIRYKRDLSTSTNPQILFNNNHVILSLPDVEYVSNEFGVVIDLSRSKTENSWKQIGVAKDFPEYDRIKNVFLYDKVTGDLITYLDVIDPIQGKIAGVADQEINWKLHYDPAVYNVNASTTGSKNVWSSDYVGKVWWDLSTAKWYNPYQDDIDYSANNWNKLLPGFSIDVYEWVESDLSPSEWDNLADTNIGIADGISGTTKYSDNRYSRATIYDPITGTFGAKYYFWVKNKKVISTYTPNRTLSSYDIAQLIQDPAGQGYRFIGIFAGGEFALYNCRSLINDKNTIIHFEYDDTNEISENHIHREYQLVTEGLETSLPNQKLVKKWIDSLVGYDQVGNQLPDLDVSIARRYGVLDQPNQSMFVNKTEALKQIVERVNSTLKNYLIVDNYDISPLTQYELPPSIYSNSYDEIVESENLIRFVGTARLERATLDLVITDGTITGVTITNPGRGYKDTSYVDGTSTVRKGPTVEVVGSGTGAKIQTYINNLGQITRAVVVNGGKNYLGTTRAIVRPFTILVSSDSTVGGFWGLYTYNTTSREWNRIQIQGYDVDYYWQYIDWYATGYSELTNVDHVIPGSYALDGLNDDLGDIVKIETIGSGGWLLLEKIDNQLEVDYTVNYKTIGRENGTIQFSNLLFNNVESGFDNQIYDAVLYDREPTAEIRIIMETLQNNIFVNELSVEWNKLFFSSVRYVLAEQPTVDWVMKTSFVKAQHNVGELDQRITFRNDNLSNYQDYVNEVKPYKTKVREYVSSYDKVDLTQTSVTDFDLQPTYNSKTKKIQSEDIKVIDSQILFVSDKAQTYPQKHWLDNVGFEITDFVIANGGTGWQSEPVVTISGGNGPTLQGRATIGNGSINKIIVDTNNATYITMPTVTVEGPQDDDGVPAIITPILGNSKVRATKVLIKFDRITGQFDITNVNKTETFSGTGATTEFVLEYPMYLNVNKIKVYVNGVESLSSEYEVYNQIDLSKGYRRYKGVVSFVNAPSTNTDNVMIEYMIDPAMLHAADRIFYPDLYQPTSGMLGKDLGQLMDGVDYAGVQIDTIGFGTEKGFDTTLFSYSAFDEADISTEDYVFRLDGSTQILELPEPLEPNVLYNVYKGSQDSIIDAIRVDDPYFGTSQQTNSNALLPTITGDGITTQINLAGYDPEVPTADGDVIIIRKSTSDGSFTSNNSILDTELAGGDFLYTTAKGIDAGEIVVDGDGFISPTANKGPEEHVPGQVYDTLDIQVYQRASSGTGLLTTRNYLADGDTFNFGFENVPQTVTSMVVKLDNVPIDSDAYEVNYNTMEIEFTDSSAIPEGTAVSVTTIGHNGTELLDTDTIIADGKTQQFNTGVTWTTPISGFVSVNGVTDRYNYTIENRNNKAHIIFTTNIPLGYVINYAIYNTEEQTYSQLLIDETFVRDGSNRSHTFGVNGAIDLPFNELPLTHKILVQVGDNFLNPGYKISHTLTSERTYSIDSWQFESTDAIAKGDVAVYLAGTKLRKDEFVWDAVDGSVRLQNVNYGNLGDKLEIYILKDAEYTFQDTVLTMTNAANLTDNFAPGEQIEFELPDSTMLNATIRSYVKDGDDVTITLQGHVSELVAYYTIDDPIEIMGDDSTPAKITNIEFVDTETVSLKDRPLVPVKIWAFSNHDVNEFDRITYNVVHTSQYAPLGTSENQKMSSVASGYISLGSDTISSNYVWVIHNGWLLSPDVDYKIINNRTVKLAKTPEKGDNIQVLHFAAPRVGTKFAYRQFKDILNRTHYKRINDLNSYELAQDLRYYDNSLVLKDATGIDLPNANKRIPGVIFIDGERIEYYQVQGNTLRQLRRSTLGTGTKLIYNTGTKIYNQGPSESIPYQDVSINASIYNIPTGLTDGTTDKLVVNFIPTNLNEFEVYLAGRRLRNHSTSVYQQEERSGETIVTDIIAQDSPEGDVTIPAEYSLNNESFEIAYIKGTNPMQIVFTENHTFVNDEKVILVNLPNDYVEFAGNLYEVSVIADNEIALYTNRSELTGVDATAYPGFAAASGQAQSDNNVIKLATVPPAGQRVQVFRKLGKTWTEPGTTLADSQTAIAKFLRGSTIKLPR